jgi:hypothetical protein
MKLRDPNTPEEWQQAVDAAKFLRAFHDAKLFGLVTGPKINVDRCDDLLRRGRDRKVFPADLDVLCRKFVQPIGLSEEFFL